MNLGGKIIHRPKKSLGQNYLTDENICRKTASAFNMMKDDPVLEIGAGTGQLTKYLVRSAGDIIAIELDENNCRKLENTFPHLRIVNDDFLNLNLDNLLPLFKKKQKKIRIIGNIPYNITSPILFKLIDSRQVIKDVQLMMQEEVAQRLTAKPNTKNYGILSVLTQTYANPELLFKVSKNCFFPKPGVDSRVVKFIFTDEFINKVADEDFFRKFVRGAFGKRRKTLRNSLKSIGIVTERLDINFDFSRRAENLSVSEFISLSNRIYNEIQK